MRTIVPFLLAAAWCAAQSAQIENLEKGLESKPDNPGARVQILQLLTVPNAIEGLSYDRVVETRRRNVLWLIEHHPEQRHNFLRAPQLIPPGGPWADPDGYAESVRMWKDRASRPDAPAAVIANAAIYLKATERAAARAILDAGLRNHPAEGGLWRAVGMVDAAALAGVTGPGDRGQFATDAALRDSPEASRARQELESADNAFLLGGAAEMLAGNLIQNQAQLNIGEVEAESLAEGWLRRAIRLAPAAGEWKTQLAPLVRAAANRAEDPRERERLFSEAAGLAPELDRAGYQMDLAKAEFEAGDDDRAARDAHLALDAALAPDLIKRNHQLAVNLFNRAKNLLGRLALARGDGTEAKALLQESLALPPALLTDTAGFRFNGPDMTLAQDLADAGERAAVIQYLETSRQFWVYDRGLLDRYIKSVKAGKKREAFTNFQSNVFELVNRPAPAFDLHEPGGKDWTLASIAGKPAALLFWNAACLHCAGQIAEFAKAAAGASVRLLAVNIGDSHATVQAYVEKNHVVVPVVEADKATAVAYRADTYPSVAVINEHGMLTQYQVGAVADPKQTLRAGTLPRIAKPVPLEAAPDAGGLTLSWRPVPGAQSYVVEWEAREKNGWPSDHDGFLRVIPTRDTAVHIECQGAVRWRVFTAGFANPGEATAWQTAGSLQ